MNSHMTISKDSVLAALIKANERIAELEKELSQRVRLDDPVVKGLVEAVTITLQFDERPTCATQLSITSRALLKENLAAYNARLKEVGCE